MSELDEWCFVFVVTAAEPIPRAGADELLAEAVEWAEENRLGVGGGYKPVPTEVDNAAVAWAFRFGLCATEDGRLIPRASAAELWELLSSTCRRQGYTCVGGFRAFTQEEVGGER